ncbi:N2,N2-dimethylguanosine tRNA methyltransferase [Zopfochytrium polystomum]|nr:N2,N2-dimethylguanosine tRNA methyltransferase [Zopfochytrium polystomum]
MDAKRVFENAPLDGGLLRDDDPAKAGRSDSADKPPRQKKQKQQRQQQPSKQAAESASADAPTSIREGTAEILTPENANTDVFYNPVQEFNRDMSVASINCWSELLEEEIAAKRAKKLEKRQGQTGESNEAEADEVTSAASKIPGAPGPALAGHPISILEALSATGLRAIRYANECPKVSNIVANDMDAVAVEAIRRNVAHNKVEDKVTPNQGDANLVMYQTLQQGKRFQVVDLDPYGTAAPFIDAAVRSVDDGGLLCITCTDMLTLAGGQYEACFMKYGSVPLPNNPFSHEMALRILLHTIQTSAIRYRRHIVPLMSCSIDFYIRVFVRVVSSPSDALQAASRTSSVYACSGCRSFVTSTFGHYVLENSKNKFRVGSGPPVSPTCELCGSKYHVGGPFYSGYLHDPAFLDRMIAHVNANKEKYKTNVRMLGMITVMSEELHDQPFYYSLAGLCGIVHCSTPPLSLFKSAILHAGYKVSVTHCKPATFKTDAPPRVLWDIILGWVAKNPVSAKFAKDPIAQRLLQITPSIVANFEKHPDADAPSKKTGLVRYQANPEKNWGPKVIR